MPDIYLELRCIHVHLAVGVQNFYAQSWAMILIKSVSIDGR